MNNARNIKWRAIAAACAAFGCMAAFAQPYPAKPARIVVGYPAGGTVDIVARMTGQKFTESMGRTSIIDNKPGAGGNIGTDYAAKSPADGYTLLVASAAALASNAAISPALLADPVGSIFA
jgi:tripartite-type tricarboxylate transporter receptor subunit TctC